jgi:hypothetical protein
VDTGIIDCIADRVRCRSAVIAVDERLIVHHRMQRRQQRVLNPVGFVQQRQHRHDGIGGAGRRRNDPLSPTISPSL